MNTYTVAPFRRNEESRLGYSPEFIAGTFSAHPRLMTSEADDLRMQGVPAKSLNIPRAGQVVPVQLGFEFHQFREDERAEPAYLFLVLDRLHNATDIVAWQPATGWLGSWLGAAWALGQESVYNPRLAEHGALSVHSSPLGWLRDSCRGIVLIRPGLAAEFLSDGGPLLAESIEHGAHLEVALTRKPPRLLVTVPGGGQ